MTTINWQSENGRLTSNGIRYIAMRTDVLMHSIQMLDAKTQAEFLNALSSSAEKFGGESIKQYARETSYRGDELIEVVATNAASLGWGEWHFESSVDAATAARKITFTVTDSPFALFDATSDTPMCGAIVGIVKSTLNESFSGVVTVKEIQCKSQGHDACLFKAIIEGENEYVNTLT